MKKVKDTVQHLIIQQPKLTALFIVVLIATPIAAFWETPTQVEIIKQQNELRIVTRLSPTSYYITGTAPGGFEYDLAKLFANYLDVELKVQVANSIAGVENSVRLNDAHLATAGLTITPERKSRFDFGPSYLRSKTLVVYLQSKGNPAPKSVADLAGHSLQVVADSSHEQILTRYEDQLEWTTAKSLEVIDLMEKVHNGELDYTLVDEHEFNAHKAFLPRLKAAFAISASQPIAWMMKQHPDGSLRDSLILFFAQPRIQQQIERLKVKYFASSQHLGLVDNLTFGVHFDERFPKYKELFKQAGEQSGIDWQLLAAIGYQESHWNPRAVSPTGVRGLMMLTQRTAKEVGVKKRTDATQSIMGGARYFAQQKDRVPDRIPEPDRTWLALAAYNVGWGHLEDARILTERAGKNPDKWADVAEHLPLLTQPRWYKTVRHGYARGREPVTYVSNIRRYVEQIRLEARLAAVQSAQDEQDQQPGTEEVINKSPETLPETL